VIYEMKELCLEITNRCPMNCMHCSGNWNIAPAADLDPQIISKIIDGFVQLGGKLLEVSGGEPLLHDRLYWILSYAKSHNLEVRLYTSGTGKDSPISLSETDALKDAGVDKVIFSLQGATARTHDTITRYPGSFETTLRGIVSMKSRGIWTGIHFVPMKPNVNELKELVKLCSSLKVDEIGILRFVAQGNGRINRAKLELSNGEFVKLLQDILDLRKKFPGVNIRTGCPLNFAALISHGPAEPCKVGKSTCVVKPNGDVMPCPAFKQDSTRVMGNVLRETLAKIWKGSAGWEEFREFDYRQLNEPCSSCEKLPSCAGRCAAQRILNLGNIYSAPDPMCPLFNFKGSQLASRIF